MKRKDLIDLFLKNGWWFQREGGNHSIYTNGRDKEAIERHNEISEILVKKMIKRRGLT